MPLRTPDPPISVAETVRSNLERAAGRPAEQLHALGGAGPVGELTATTPHQVFTVGLQALADGAGLEAAPATGWRYLLRQDAKVVATAETVTAAGGDHQFAQFNRGPFAAATTQALEVATTAAGPDGPDYELRMLHVPALHALAIWLHDAGGDDELIPLAPAPPGVEPNHVYAAAELLDILAGLARGALEETSDDRGS